MAEESINADWLTKVGNISQLGGIETSIVDNGPARGNRIAWINTGCGLRYKVIIDRCLDIVDAFYNADSLAWISHGGSTAPRPDANIGIEWLWSFAGGLLTTCGLTHVGGPESDEDGQSGLHGRAANLVAQLESIVQPNPWAGKLDMSITALIKQSRVFGPNLELRRTISSTLGEPALKVTDVVTNCANTPTPHMLLYHCNFGYPLVDEGVDIVAHGRWTSRGLEMDDAVFNENRNYKKCSNPLSSHQGAGEGCAFIDVKADKAGLCTVGLANHKRVLALVMKYKKKQLPWLSNWQHWGPGEYVTALEPGTNPPIGRAAAAKQKKLISLAPGKSRKYELEFSILTDKKAIADFVESAR